MEIALLTVELLHRIAPITFIIYTILLSPRHLSTRSHDRVLQKTVRTSINFICARYNSVLAVSGTRILRCLFEALLSYELSLLGF